MSHSRDSEARHRIREGYIGFKSATFGVNTVTFQPKGKVDANEDRIVTDIWDLYGHRWLVLAVFDGHVGSTAVQYTSQTFPTVLRTRLQDFIGSIGGRLDRTNFATHQAQVTKLIQKAIMKFDDDLGDAVRDICPRPEELTEEQARRLIAEHQEVLERAFHGTTMALALINVDQRFMWAAGVGDSSVGLSYMGRDGVPKARRLCTMHTFKNPQQYFMANMAHPASEQPLFDWEDRLLGWQTIARAFGNYSMKFPVAYLANLFRYLPGFEDAPFDDIIARIKTPPYVVNWPSVCFTDLDHFWWRQSKIFLFSDGVDNLVDGWLVFKPRQHSGGDPVDVVSALLGDRIEPRIEQILGHPVIPRWSGQENNQAIDVLGNLLGGTDVERLEAVTDLERLNKPGWPFHIDDTSIIVWRVADPQRS